MEDGVAELGVAVAGDLAVFPGPSGPGLSPQRELTRKILDYDPKAETSLIDEIAKLPKFRGLPKTTMPCPRQRPDQVVFALSLLCLCAQALAS